MNWIIEESQSADPRGDRVILENPAAVKELDELLIEKYYPPIRRALQDTGYAFSSIDDDAIPIESRWSGPELGRCLTFMLFDGLGGAILRGSLTRSRTGFLFGREFFLGLPETTEPSFLFRIMAEEDFAGMMPRLTIQRSRLHPEWDTYYSITLESAAGVSGGPWTLDQAAIGTIDQTIRTSIAMYESTIDGFATMADVEEFIELARECFEAS